WRRSRRSQPTSWPSPTCWPDPDVGHRSPRSTTTCRSRSPGQIGRADRSDTLSHEGANEMTMGALDGKVALVTGASRGIGRSIAERLARDGALVAVNFAGNAEAASATVAAIEAAGGAAFAVQAEIGTPEATAALFTALDVEVERRTGEA